MQEMICTGFLPGAVSVHHARGAAPPVHTSGKKRFSSYGDANPSNVSSLVRGAGMRMAETRAVNRALCKAYGIGLWSIKEFGCSPKPSETVQSSQAKTFSALVLFVDWDPPGCSLYQN